MGPPHPEIHSLLHVQTL